MSGSQMFFFLDKKLKIGTSRFSFGATFGLIEYAFDVTLKSDSHLPKQCVICFIESPLKMMKNGFYFILKALFVLKVFKFSS